MQEWNVLSEYRDGENIIAQILYNRGIRTKKEIDAFLNPHNLKEYFSELPEDFKNALKEAKNIIEEAMNNKNPIVIHGDYDADGISATAVLYNTIYKELGYKNCLYFIPSRFEHGYGLSKNSLDEIKRLLSEKFKKYSGSPLLITVDCGITAVEELRYAGTLGFKTIITDHHQKPEELPEARCIVWSDKLVGTSVAWFLSRVLGSRDTGNLALVALATVTDLQPLVGINRGFVKKGLEIINTTPPPGLKKIADISGKLNSEITAYDLGWVIGPRINASGRLQEAQDSLKLLIEEDPSVLDAVAKNLHEINTRRQDKTIQMLELASSGEDFSERKVIISVDENYHEGIIGLVAARLTQKYYRPSIVISLSDDVGKGSVRSIPGIDIISVLRRFEPLFLSLGGHPMAAGFSIERNRIEEMRESVTRFIEETYGESSFKKVLNIDMKIPIEIVGTDLLESMEALKPFGLGNEEPVFCVTDAGVFSAAKVGGESRHLVLKIFENGRYYKAVYFNEGYLADSLFLGQKVDLAFTLKRNDYNGKTYVDMVVKDLKILGSA